MSSELPIRKVVGNVVIWEITDEAGKRIYEFAQEFLKAAQFHYARLDSRCGACAVNAEDKGPFLNYVLPPDPGDKPHNLSFSVNGNNARVHYSQTVAESPQGLVEASDLVSTIRRIIANQKHGTDVYCLEEHDYRIHIDAAVPRDNFQPLAELIRNVDKMIWLYLGKDPLKIQREIDQALISASSGKGRTNF